MTMQVQTKDWELLDKITKLVVDYGVNKVEESCDKKIEITYEIIGEGSALSSMIEDMFSEFAPDRDFRIKMIPSDKKLIVELL